MFFWITPSRGPSGVVVMTFARRMTVVALAVFTAGLISCARQPAPRQSKEKAAALLPPAEEFPFDVLTQHNNPYRTGASLNETILNPESVKGGKFQRLFCWKVSGQIYAQPLYVSRVPY